MDDNKAVPLIDYMTFGCIYEIKCLGASRSYIGRTSNYFYRIVRHTKELCDGRHHNNFMQSDFDTFGIDNFLAQVLVIAPEKDLVRLECSTISDFIEGGIELYNDLNGVLKGYPKQLDVDVTKVTEDNLSNTVRAQFEHLRSWAATGRHYGVSRTVVWRIVNDGYIPQKNETRRALGLPEIIIHQQPRDKRGRFATTQD